MLQKNIYRIKISDYYTNVYNKNMVREIILTRRVITRNNVKLDLRGSLTMFFKSVFRPKNKFKCFSDKKAFNKCFCDKKKKALVIFKKNIKKNLKSFFEKHMGSVFLNIYLFLF